MQWWTEQGRTRIYTLRHKKMNISLHQQREQIHNISSIMHTISEMNPLLNKGWQNVPFKAFLSYQECILTDSFISLNCSTYSDTKMRTLTKVGFSSPIWWLLRNIFPGNILPRDWLVIVCCSRLYSLRFISVFNSL